MKSSIWNATTAAALAVTATALLAERPDLGVSANVPFRFESGKVSVAQGRFEVRHANPSSVLRSGSVDVLVLPRAERLKEFERAGVSRPVEVALVEAAVAGAAAE